MEKKQTNINKTQKINTKAAKSNTQKKSITSNIADQEMSLLRWKKRLIICALALGICVVIALLVFLLQVLSTPVAIVLWTFVFVFLLRGIVNKLETKGVNRVIGTIIAYLVMVLVIALVCLFMFSPVFGFSDQIKNIIENIPYYVNIATDWVRDMYGQYGHYLQDENIQKWINDTASSLSTMGGDIASASANGIITAGGFIGNMFMSLGIALVIAFWILTELPSIGREANRFVKDRYEEDAKMWQMAFTQVMSGFIKGTFLQCLIIGVASGLAFWAMGAANCGALGCIVGVLNIIPIFGPILGSLVAFIGGIFVNIWIAIIGLVVVAAIQGFVYTFISPKIMSNSCNIHPVLTLLALTAGGAIGGVISGPIGSLVGMLLAIPLVAVFKSLFIYYYEKRTGVRIVSEEGFFFKGTPYSKTEVNPFCDALSIKCKEDAGKGKAKTKVKAKKAKK